MGILGVIIAPVATAITQRDEINTYIQSQAQASHIPAVSYAIVKDGRVITAKGIGQGVTDSTPFVLGSVSKSFTALAIMQLVDAHKIQLDDPVSTYIPWFKTAQDDPSHPITVRHLLTQTSGLPSSAGLVDINDTSLTLEQRVRALSQVDTKTVPGQTFEIAIKTTPHSAWSSNTFLGSRIVAMSMSIFLSR